MACSSQAWHRVAKTSMFLAQRFNFTWRVICLADRVSLQVQSAGVQDGIGFDELLPRTQRRSTCWLEMSKTTTCFAAVFHSLLIGCELGAQLERLLPFMRRRNMASQRPSSMEAGNPWQPAARLSGPWQRSFPWFCGGVSSSGSKQPGASALDWMIGVPTESSVSNATQASREMRALREMQAMPTGRIQGVWRFSVEAGPRPKRPFRRLMTTTPGT